MYRAVTLEAIERGVDVADAEALCGHRAVDEPRGRRAGHPRRQGRHRGDPCALVTVAVSIVAAHPEVRAELVRRQRAWVAANGGGVVEGRDIGSVVLPEADVKIFLTADSAERASRRVAEEGPAGPAALAMTAESIRRRDELDSTRATSPLVAPPDAIVARLDGTQRRVRRGGGALPAMN